VGILNIIGRLILFLIGLYFLGGGLFCGTAALFSSINLWIFSLIGFGFAWLGFYLIKLAFRNEAKALSGAETRDGAATENLPTETDKGEPR
jgi:hypothetical protein